MSKQRLVEMAEGKLRDAKYLLDADSPGNAYYLAGYAIELMLKAIISSRFRADTLPERDWSQRIFVHDLRRLVGLALLNDAHKQEADTNTDFAVRFQVALGWTETSRYDLRDSDQATELIEALDHPEHGVMQWLRRKL